MLTMLLETKSTQKGHILEPSALIEHHADYLFRAAVLRIGDESLAEDLVQETLLAAIKNMKNFTFKSSERTWLTAILKNKIVDYFRRTKHEKIFDFSGNCELADEKYFQPDGSWNPAYRSMEWNADPSTVIENQEFWQIVSRCLSSLPKRMATAFVLREIDGLSSEEICETLNISLNNLWVMLHRARLELRREMEINFFLSITVDILDTIKEK